MAFPLGNGKSIRIPPLLEGMQKFAATDKMWQSEMFTLLNDPENQTPDFDSFRLLCRLIEKNMRIHINSMKWLPTFYLFDSSAQIRMCISALSDLFVLDNLCHRLNHGLPDEVSFPNGQKFDLVGMALLGVPAHLPDLLLLQKKLAELKYDKFDHACLKVLLFFDSRLNMFNKSDEQLSKATCDMTKSLLLQHCLQNYPHIPNKFDQLLAQLPKFRTLSMRGQRNLHTLHSPMRRPFESLLIEVLVGNHENVEAHFLSKSQL